MRAELADGRVLEFPDGTSPDVIQRTVKSIVSQSQPVQPVKVGKEGFGDAMREVVGNEGWLGRNLAGAGTALTNLWEGAKQIAGKGDDTAIEGNRIMAQEAPVGALAGNLAALAPTALVPGANTVAGAGVVGALQGALQPTMGDESRLTNTVAGGALGAGSQFAGNKAGQYLTSRLADKTAQAAADASRNSVRDATLKAAQEAGYTVPPSTVNPSWINKRLESIAGKAAVGQESAMRNQEVTNSLVRKALGMAEDAPITEDALKQIRTLAGKPYQEVAAMSKDAADALEMLKQARFDTNAQFKYYGRSADPSALAKALSSKAEAQGWEQFIEQTAQGQGRNDLAQALKDARQTIAKTYSAERALNTSTGNIAAADLAKALDKGAPLSGELETVARFADAFPQLAREGSKIPTPGVSKSEALAAALLGGTVHPVAAALPLASPAVRAMVLSKPYQALMAAPKYGPSLTTQALGKIGPERAALLARALAATSLAAQ